MSDVLRIISEDALFLKNQVIGARATGDLTPEESQHAITACARLLQIIAEARTPHAAPQSREPEGLLSDFFRWPSASMPCPKCGGSKGKFVDYVPFAKMGAERMKHSCRCGYFIYTKPVDQSPDYDLRGDAPEWDAD